MCGYLLRWVFMKRERNVNETRRELGLLRACERSLTLGGNLVLQMGRTQRDLSHRLALLTDDGQ